MTAEVVPVSQLSSCNDEDFDKVIKEMSLKTLMESISGLQKEMAREQENFNSLNAELQSMKSRNSSQYKSISREMVTSQTRLTLLMNRSMKCFAQQNLQQGKQGPVQLRRRNSAKGDQPSPTKSSTSVQRSKSMYIPPQPDPDPPATRIIKAGSSALINQNPNTSKPYTPVIANGVLTTRPPAGARVPADRVKGQVHMVNAINKPTSNGIQKLIMQDNIQNNLAPVTNGSNGEKEALQILPSVRMLAKNFSVSEKSIDSNVAKSNKPRLVKLRSSESMRIERPVSDGLVFSSKQNNDAVMNGTRSEQTSSGRHVVSTVLKFDPSPKYKSTDNLSTIDMASPRPRTNSIPRVITVASSAREVTQANDVNSSINKVTLTSNGKTWNSTPKENQQPRTTVNVKTNGSKAVLNNSVKSNKVEYNMFPGKDALMQEIVSRRKDSDVETTRIEVTEHVLKSKPVVTAQSTQQTDTTREQTATTTQQTTASTRQTATSMQQTTTSTQQTTTSTRQTATSKQQTPVSKTGITHVVTTKVFVQAQDPKAAPSQGITENQQGGGVPSDGNASTTSVPVVVKSGGSQGPPEKPARRSRPDSQNLLDKGRQPSQAPGPPVAAPPTDPSTRVKLVDQDDDEVTPRINLRNWDPSLLLKEVYSVRLMEDNAEDISHQFIAMEGYMEKLPMNKKKSTLLKTWKRRFFKAVDGWLYYYESSNRDKPSDTVQLMGGRIDDMSNRILGIDDGRGKFLMVRCPTEREHGQWKLALESQTADNTKANYIRPALRANPHPQKNVVIIDLGSTSVRAGILGDQATMPALFFPSVVAVHKTTDALVVGSDAYKPSVRHESVLSHPISPSNKVDKDHCILPFNIDSKQMPAVFDKIFRDLGVNPSQYMVMISTPQSLGDNLRKSLMELLMSRHQVAGVCMVQQSLLSLYSYNATSGIIVDIGERIEILPIFDGFVIEGGMARLPYGAQKVQDTLLLSLLADNYKFSSSVEKLLVRYVMEKSCYVPQNYKEEVQRCKMSPDSIKSTVSLDNFNLPPEAYKSVTHDESRFRSPEGLFDTDMWEMDFPNLHKLVFQAIQACPMDSRRRMFRAVYLSGGVTMMPGFVDRLQHELMKLAPPSVPVEVHAAPQRYHAAYVGACAVAGMAEFEHMCISRDEWRDHGVKAFRKWNAPSS
ncbi:uncharacterized protein [Haliotis cracherodii]|uniref:uncharacterized protein isoform X1 n=1 Tax=Haliotis cracherodii TaxID=6455 RepID=UPI0039E9056C